MLHRALRFGRLTAAFVPLATVMLAAVAIAEQSESGEVKQKVGSRLLAAVRLGGGAAEGKLDAIIENGDDAFRNAAFSVAIDWYDKALETDPASVDVQARLQHVVEKRNQKREALGGLPRNADRRRQYYQGAYNRARQLYRAKKYGQAYGELYELWLLEGDYEDILKLMERSLKRGDLEARGLVTADLGWNLPEPIEAVFDASSVAHPVVVAAAPPPVPEPKASPEISAAPARLTRPSRTARSALPAEQVRAIPNDGIRSLLTSAAEAMANADAAGAERFYGQALALDRANSEARVGIERARAQLAQAQAPEPSVDVDELMLRAQVAAQSGRLDRARELYGQALNLEPGNRVVQNGLAKLDRMTPPIAVQTASRPIAPIEAASGAPNEIVPRALPSKPAPPEAVAIEGGPGEKAEHIELDLPVPALPLPELDASSLAGAQSDIAPDSAGVGEVIEQAEADYAEQIRAEARVEMKAQQSEALEAEEARREQEAQAQAREAEEQTRRRVESERQARLTVLLEQASLALRAQEFDLAEQNYREALAVDGSNREAKKGLDGLGRARAKQAEAKQQEIVRVALDRAETLMDASQLGESIQSYEAVLADDPGNRRAKNGLKQAEQILEHQAVERKRQAIDADLAIARDYIANGARDQARATLEYVLNQDARRSEAIDLLAQLDRIEAAPAGSQDEPFVMEQDPATLDVSKESPPVARTADPGPLPESSSDEKQFATAASGQGDLNGIDGVEIAQADGESEVAATAIAPAPDATAPNAIDLPGGRFATTAPVDAVLHEIDQQTNREPLDRQDVPDAEQPRDVAQIIPPESIAVAEGPRPAPTAIDHERIRTLHAMARRQFDEGDLEGARLSWREILVVDPEDAMAATYLDQTQAEFDRLEADRALRDQAEQRRADRAEILTSPVSISTDGPIPLSEFMRLISFSTVQEIEYYIASGANAQVSGLFENRRLEVLLNIVLGPLGLTWEMDERNIITIKSDLRPATFKLNLEQVKKIRSMLDNKQLQEIVWRSEEAPATGMELSLDERQRILLVVGPQLHIDTVQEFLAALEIAEVPEMETRFYKINSDDGPRIKALIDALVTSDADTPFDVDRRIFIESNDLIVRDSPDNLIKIEELLLDQAFIDDLRDEDLEIANFNLIPREIENQDSEQIRFFTSKAVEAIDTLLYARTGLADAAGDGRRRWFDPTTYQLTLVDTPTNIGRVSDYINSLPQLTQQRRQEVIFLRFQIAESMAEELNTILELQTGFRGGRSVGGLQTQRLRRGETFTFGDLRVRLTRIESGDPLDRNDDEVELQLVTGTQTSTLNVRELETTFFDNYEITAERVNPSGGGGGAAGGIGNRGDGNATIAVRVIDPVQADAPADGGDDEGVSQDEAGISINPFGPLNALILRYDDPALFQDALDLIEQLDKPTPQVEVETKFVEVNETRAKEFSSDFRLDGLTQGTNFNTDFWKLNSRFAQDQDEFRSLFEPNIEQGFDSSLIKGTTILDLVLGDVGNGPSVGFQLRMLEAEGIVNISSGPKVAMMDGITGQFIVETGGPGVGGGGGGGGGGAAVLGNFTGPGSAATFPLGGENLNLDDGVGLIGNRSSAAILEVIPDITSEESIILDIQVDILDNDVTYASSFFLDPTLAGFPQQLPTNLDPDQTLSDPVNIAGVPTFLGPGFRNAVVGDNALGRNRKSLETTARVEDGGTMILGGWSHDYTQELTSGVPVLRNMPFVGKLLFSRNQKSVSKRTLLIFLTANLID